MTAPARSHAPGAAAAQRDRGRDPRRRARGADRGGPYDELRMDAIARRGVRLAHDGLLLLRQQARASSTASSSAPSPTCARAAAPYLDGDGRAAARAAPGADPGHRRGQRQRGRAPASPPGSSAQGDHLPAEWEPLHPAASWPTPTGAHPSRPGARASPRRHRPGHQRPGAVRDGGAPRDDGDHPRRPPDHGVGPRAVRAVVARGVLAPAERARGDGAPVRGSRRPRARSRR